MLLLPAPVCGFTPGGSGHGSPMVLPLFLLCSVRLGCASESAATSLMPREAAECFELPPLQIRGYPFIPTAVIL